MKPSWKIIVEIADATEDGAMPTEWKKLGEVKDGSITPDNQEGTTKELINTEGDVVDSFKFPDRLGWKMVVFGIPDELKKKFWEVTDKDGVSQVKSMSNNKDFAIRMLSPDLPGTDAVAYPRCKVNMGMGYSNDDTFYSEIGIKVQKPKNGVIFEHGPVEKIKGSVEA